MTMLDDEGESSPRLTHTYTYAEQATGKGFEEWLCSGDEAVLSPCRYTSFEVPAGQQHAPPLFIDLGTAACSLSVRADRIITIADHLGGDLP
jgi:hypothetical protein